MTISLNDIQKPISSELKKFNSFFRSSIKSNTPLLNVITNYVVRRSGKQMRPMFVFFSAQLMGEINQSTYIAASFIELLHTATLIHDDIVDDTSERRGFFSVNALWKNKISVLLGDYMLSRGLLLAVKHKEYELLEIVSEAVREMSEGELLQIEKARKLDIEESIYYEIIRKKTAVLFAACTATGAKSVGANVEHIEKMRLFGESLGMAFQIKDDIFDYYYKTNLIGKPTGNDIKEKKMTLPLIYVLNNCSRVEKSKIINTIKNNNKNSQKVKEVIDFVISHGGLEYATKVMIEFKNKALSILNTFPDTPSRRSLEKLVEYTVQRTK